MKNLGSREKGYRRRKHVVDPRPNQLDQTILMQIVNEMVWLSKSIVLPQRMQEACLLAQKRDKAFRWCKNSASIRNKPRYSDELRRLSLSLSNAYSTVIHPGKDAVFGSHGLPFQSRSVTRMRRLRPIRLPRHPLKHWIWRCKCDLDTRSYRAKVETMKYLISRVRG